MSLLNDLTAITTPALTDIVYCVQNSTDYKVTNEQLIALSKTNIIIPKTQAQYDALTPAEKNNGALYIITDAVITADDVEYSSGVSVADKIDGIIDDTTTSQDSTWSSDKISGEIAPLKQRIYTGECNVNSPYKLKVSSFMSGILMVFVVTEGMKNIAFDVYNNNLQSQINLRTQQSFSSPNFSISYNSTDGLILSSNTGRCVFTLYCSYYY